MLNFSELKPQGTIEVQKEVHASKLWQQGLNDVMLKSCHTIVLKTLPLIVPCKIFLLMSAQARNYYYEKVCVFDRNLVDQKKISIWTLFTQ